MLKLPKTRYQGSKNKLLDKIYEEIQSTIPQTNCILDLFGGTSIVSLFFKSKGYNVFYNDIMKFNTSVAQTLLNSSRTDLPTDEEIRGIFVKRETPYNNIVEKHFIDVYFTDIENKQLDIAIQNINTYLVNVKKDIMLYLLIQACISKRPYNLFHRKNLCMRLNEVKRTFGNKKTWDTSFVDHMIKFKKELYDCNLQSDYCEILNLPYNQIPEKTLVKVDTVYIDPPYFTHNKPNDDYISYYHFLEGLIQYDTWESLIDFESLHRKFKGDVSSLYTLTNPTDMFTQIIEKFSDKNIVISYRSDGFPSIDYIINKLKQVKGNVVLRKIEYKYALAKKPVQECIIIAY
jgi:adenine-specific DNA-methyltransferase